MNEMRKVVGGTECALRQKQGDQLVEVSTGIVGAVFSSIDGLEIASRLQPELLPETLDEGHEGAEAERRNRGRRHRGREIEDVKSRT